MKTLKQYIRESLKLISSKTKLKQNLPYSPIELVCELLCITEDTAPDDYDNIISYLNNVWKNYYKQFDIDNIKCIGYKYSGGGNYFKSDITSMSQYNSKLKDFYEFDDHEKFMKLYDNSDNQKVISTYYGFNTKTGKYESNWIFECYKNRILTWYKNSSWGIITLE